RGPADLLHADPLVEALEHARRSRLDAVLDVRAPGAAHGDETLFIDDVDARLAVPEKVDAGALEAAAEVEHPLAVRGEGVVPDRQVHDAVLLPQQPHLLDHVGRGSEAQAAPPELRRRTEGAGRRAAARGDDELELRLRLDSDEV